MNRSQLPYPEHLGLSAVGGSPTQHYKKAHHIVLLNIGISQYPQPSQAKICLLKSGKEFFGGNWLSIHVRKRESMNGLIDGD